MVNGTSSHLYGLCVPMGQTPCHRSTIELRASNPRQGVFGPGADQSPDPTPFLVFSPKNMCGL